MPANDRIWLHDREGTQSVRRQVVEQRKLNRPFLNASLVKILRRSTASWCSGIRSIVFLLPADTIRTDVSLEEALNQGILDPASFTILRSA